MSKKPNVVLVVLVFAVLSFLCTGCGRRSPSTSTVEESFRRTFLCSFGCLVRSATVTKQSDDRFTIDYAYRQCPYCHTDINFADDPCRGHAPQMKRGRATAEIDGSGTLHFYLNSGREFDSWGVK